jgi:4-amino-4-deoxy-L-arabinose transferase-like glycosyltransferase
MTEPSNRVYSLVSPILIILAIGAFFLLFHLDHQPFWQDEAETAGLAKNTLKYGVPRAYDGVNIISQEAGKEYDQNFLWRWSPWLQIYVTAAAFRVGGLTTYAGRFPFAILGLACIFLVYRLLQHNFDNRPWALMSAALLTCSVPFLLFSRQCRYYSLGAFFTLLSLYAFREDWQTKRGPALLLCFSLGLLFYSNYLLFLSYTGAALLAAVLLFYSEIPLARSLKLIAATGIIILPGLFLFSIQQQATMISLEAISKNLGNYFGDFFQFLIPLPVALYLGWRWGRLLWDRTALPQESEERFILFLSLIIIGNILILSPAPQCEHRYLVHLYPLCAIILGWLIFKTWRYHKFSGALLGLLLLFTNWLWILPLDWMGLLYRPVHNDPHMLPYPNLPLKLYLTELSSPYPDVNQNLIQFFNSHAHPGDTILTTYEDLPLQFYTRFKVLGGLQHNMPLSQQPDWLVLRWYTRWNRDYDLNESEKLIRQLISDPAKYQQVDVAAEDEIYGNRADPYFHHFMPRTEPLSPVAVYEKISPTRHNP